MKALLFSVIFLSVVSVKLTAQNTGIVSGTVRDSILNTSLPNATVTVLLKKDSTLLSFDLTDQKGRFLITSIPVGEYRLLVTYAGYKNKSIYFTVSAANRIYNYDSILLVPNSALLDEIVVKAEAPPITMIGDTVQYNTGSFKTPPNSVVEELLKKLPGIEVARDGTIKAMGQTVNKVLVDGKEFFGTNPKIATKNLSADAIAKVQIFDSESDQARLTGFNEVNNPKTINLKLKDDKKKGVFGKTVNGMGTNKRFLNYLNLNSFAKTRQVSVIGAVDNINDDNGNDLNNGGSIGSSVSSSGTGSVAAISGVPIQKNFGTGLNFNHSLSKKVSFKSNYIQNQNNSISERYTARQYFLPDSTYFSSQSSVNKSNASSHIISTGVEYQIDSLHYLRFLPTFQFKQVDENLNSVYEQLSEEKLIVNNGYNNYKSDMEASSFSGSLLFGKKFKSKRRTFLTSFDVLGNRDYNSVKQESETIYYSSGISLGALTFNQVRKDKVSQFNYALKFMYTEPILRNALLHFKIGVDRSGSKAYKTTYDFNLISNEYDLINDSLSNNFQNAVSLNGWEVKFRKQSKKYLYDIGFELQTASLYGSIILDATKDSVIKKKFKNVLPSAVFQYNITKYNKLIFSYSTITNQPTLSQLQPVPDVSNPNYLRIGNPFLKQEFVHSLQVNYSKINLFRNKNFNATINFRGINNKIVSSDSIFSTGVVKTIPQNLNGNYNIFGNMNYGLPLQFIKGTLSIISGFNFTKSRQYLNGEIASLNATTLSEGLKIDVNQIEDVMITLYGYISYTNTSNSSTKDAKAKQVAQHYDVYIHFRVNESFFLSTSLNYTANNSSNSNSMNIAVPLWSASVSKLLFKNKRGEVKLKVFDIMNKNIGSRLSVNQNYIEDSRSVILRRYAIVSFTYNFNKIGK
jgi:hypothetical protein